VEHLGSQAVEHGEADIGAVLGRVIVDPERTPAEGGVHHLNDRIGDAGGIRIVWVEIGVSQMIPPLARST
jgi:hypothetical protein